jgi:hypothetical protein
MDAFERRVAETLRWYADNVTPVVDAVDVAHRVALAHPRQRRGPLFEYRVAVPHLGAPARLAWLLLLLAGGLVTMVGGMLISGAQPAQDSRVVVPPIGEAFECPPGSTPDVPGPVDQARPAGLSTMAFDRRAGQIVAVADKETWTFDVCTNTWTQKHPDQSPVLPERPGLVYDEDSDRTIGAWAYDVWAYDRRLDIWTKRGRAPGYVESWTYDPASEQVVAWDGEELRKYDVGTDTWTPIQADWPGAGPEKVLLIAYDRSVDGIVAYDNGRATLRLDPDTGTWERSGAETPEVGAGWGMSPPAIVYDETAKRTVVMGWDLAVYDATEDRWEVTDNDVDMSTTVYDPVNGRLVVPGSSGEMTALDTQTRTWTVLLEPTDGQSSPSNQ